MYRLEDTRLFVFICGICFLVVASCTRPIDPTTSSILTEMSKRNDKYFSSLIKDFGTQKCRYSAEVSQKYWRETNSDLRVVDARFSALEALKKISNEYFLLKEAYSKTETTLELFDDKPAKLPNGQPSYCLDPDALTPLWINIQSATQDLGQVSNFK